MDDLETIKDKVRFIFNGYKSTDPAMEVYEIEGELILGLPHEIGYKIMDFAPDSLVARAEISHEYFELMLEAIATQTSTASMFPQTHEHWTLDLNWIQP